MDMEWPKHLPPDCPPTDAQSKSIEVYRFLDNDNQLKHENFLTVKEKSPNRAFKQSEKECRACALSVFTDRDEVIALQDTVPRWRRPIAIGKINTTSGLIKHTPSSDTNNSHHSWWVPVNIKPWQLFSQVIEAPTT
jgi:hypothetical protein